MGAPVGLTVVRCGLPAVVPSRWEFAGGIGGGLEPRSGCGRASCRRLASWWGRIDDDYSPATIDDGPPRGGFRAEQP